jgi:hypothetical protein
MNNPYSPPKAKLSDGPPKPGSALKAVLIGLAVDLGGTMAGGLLLGLVYATILASQGNTEEAIGQALQNVGETGWGFTLVSAMGCGFSILGGYVCARISRATDIRLGLVLGGLSAGSGIVLGGGGDALGQTLLLCAATVASVLLGTRYGISATRSR